MLDESAQGFDDNIRTWHVGQS